VQCIIFGMTYSCIWCLKLNKVYLTFSIWHFKYLVSAAAAGALFNLNAHCGTLFSLSYEKDVLLMGQHCPVCPFIVKVSNSKLHQQHSLPVRHGIFHNKCWFHVNCSFIKNMVLVWTLNSLTGVSHSVR